MTWPSGKQMDVGVYILLWMLLVAFFVSLSSCGAIKRAAEERFSRVSDDAVVNRYGLPVREGELLRQAAKR